MKKASGRRPTGDRHGGETVAARRKLGFTAVGRRKSKNTTSSGWSSSLRERREQERRGEERRERKFCYK
ncbi:hypothetical protein A2U01_0053141 [Trifolium medium]|uniref:Uncharacterized protein n=1 Tax=Trifolium medium TaxID=97028 RepID=A0A392R6R8_9FABA|nr:hypothetical protein [Trifolium medium]